MDNVVTLPPVLRTLDADGTLHFSHLKAYAKSGAHSLHAVNAPNEPTRPMLISTGVHQVVLGPRADKKIVVFDGSRRQGNAWDEFEAAHAGEEILTLPEWSEAKFIGNALLEDPLIQEKLDGARFEVPLRWRDGEFECSTSGIDIVRPGEIGDLKGTHCAEPERFKRHAFSMFYHCQLAWYRRGCRANGIDTSRGLFVLGYEMEPPFAVVPLEMTEELIDLGERTLSLWLEYLRRDVLSCPAPTKAKDWPAYTQSPVPWPLPAFMQRDEDESEAA